MNNQSKKSSPSDVNIEKEVRSAQKGSLAAALGREAGGMMKGGSPVPLILQAETAIFNFIDKETKDSHGALKEVLHNKIKQDKAHVAEYVNNPLMALKVVIENIVTHNELYFDFVREVDMKYGELFNERPIFQKPGDEAHPDDEYTHESVKGVLNELLAKIGTAS